MGLELLAEAGNYAALQRLYGPSYGWPYPPQPSTAAAAAAAAALVPAAASVDLYYRQAAAAAALQKPLAYRLYPPGLPILPQVASDPLRDALRPEAMRPGLRLDSTPDLLKSDPGKMEGRIYPLDSRLGSPMSRETDDDQPAMKDITRPMPPLLPASPSPSPSPPQCPSPTDLRVRASPDPHSDPHKPSH